MTYSKIILSGLVLLAVGSAQAKTKSSPAAKTTTYTSTSSSDSFFSDWSDKELSLTGTSGSFESYKVGTSSVTEINVSAGLSTLVYEQVQAGAELSFASVSGGSTSRSGFGILAFGAYNFDYSLRESMYAKGGLGTFPVEDGKGGLENKFGFMVGGGKRIPLWEKVTYTPEARLMKIGDLDMQFKIQFLNFSYLF